MNRRQSYEHHDAGQKIAAQCSTSKSAHSLLPGQKKRISAPYCEINVSAGSKSSGNSNDGKICPNGGGGIFSRFSHNFKRNVDMISSRNKEENVESNSTTNGTHQSLFQQRKKLPLNLGGKGETLTFGDPSHPEISEHTPIGNDQKVRGSSVGNNNNSRAAVGGASFHEASCVREESNDFIVRDQTSSSHPLTPTKHCEGRSSLNLSSSCRGPSICNTTGYSSAPRPAVAIKHSSISSPKSQWHPAQSPKTSKAFPSKFFSSSSTRRRSSISSVESLSHNLPQQAASWTRHSPQQQLLKHSSQEHPHHKSCNSQNKNSNSREICQKSNGGAHSAINFGDNSHSSGHININPPNSHTNRSNPPSIPSPDDTTLSNVLNEDHIYRHDNEPLSLIDHNNPLNKQSSPPVSIKRRWSISSRRLSNTPILPKPSHPCDIPLPSISSCRGSEGKPVAPPKKSSSTFHFPRFRHSDKSQKRHRVIGVSVSRFLRLRSNTNSNVQEGIMGAALGNCCAGRDDDTVKAKARDKLDKSWGFLQGDKVKGDVDKFDEAYAANDIKGFVNLIASTDPIDELPERMHPWAADPKSVGALATTQLAILAAKDDDPNIKNEIREAGAIPLLVKNLGSKEEDRVQSSVVALSFLSVDNPKNCSDMFDEGALPYLVKGMSSSIDGMRGATAQTCRNIFTLDLRHRTEFKKAGGIPALVGLLDLPSGDYDPESLFNELEAVYHLEDFICEAGEELPEFVADVKQAGAARKLEALGKVNNSDLSEAAKYLLVRLAD